MTGTIEKADSKDLKKYYRFVYVCRKKKCKRRYGSDEKLKNGNKLCPICENKLLYQR